MIKTIAIALCVLTAGVGGYAAGAREQKADRFFELRTYTPSPGKMDALHARFRDHTCKLFEKHGMTNVGYWVTAGAEPKLVYVLAFPSKEARDASFKAFGADPDWQKVYADSQKDGIKLAAKVESVFLTPADYSAIK
ncbi:MAG TPA: NIPSNAP family protein [Planctomycetota bacterium]